MERQYYIVKVPNGNAIHALNVCVGENATQRYSLDSEWLFVKTTNDLIAKEEGKGVHINQILPPGITIGYSYLDILVVLRGVLWQTITQ